MGNTNPTDGFVLVAELPSCRESTSALHSSQLITFRVFSFFFLDQCKNNNSSSNSNEKQTYFRPDGWDYSVLLCCRWHCDDDKCAIAANNIKQFSVHRQHTQAHAIFFCCCCWTDEFRLENPLERNEINVSWGTAGKGREKLYNAQSNGGIGGESVVTCNEASTLDSGVESSSHQHHLMCACVCIVFFFIIHFTLVAVLGKTTSHAAIAAAAAAAAVQSSTI